MKHTILATATAIAVAGPAAAAPFTFRFDMPAFTTGTLSGQTSVLDVTADNGSASVLSQSYLNTDITGYFVTVGSVSLRLGEPDDTQNATGSQVYITTDALGTPTLDLTADVDSNLFFTTGSEAIQLGTISGDSGPIPYGVSLSGLNGNRLQGFTVVGTLVDDGPDAAIPLPAPALLLLSGLGALALLRRG